MENNFGKELHFDAVNYEATIRLAKYLLPFISKLVEAYETLGMGPITTESYRDLTSAGTSSIRDPYSEFIDKEIQRLKVKSKSISDAMRSGIDQNLLEVENALNGLKTELRNQVSLHAGITLPLTLENFAIVDGKPVLSEEAIERIKRHFTISIETDIQEAVYDRLEKIRNLAIETIEYLQSKNWDVYGYPLLGADNSFLQIERTGLLTIDPNAIENLNRSRGYLKE